MINKNFIKSLLKSDNYYFSGRENFTHEILLTGLTQEEAEEFEKQYIAKYKNGGKCYNILDGGLTTADTSKKVYQYDLNGQFIKE